LYSVRINRYTSSQVRERLADVLDAAERGEEVVVERRGVRFVIRAERARRSGRNARQPMIEILDPAVAEGAWTWTFKSAGLTFLSKRRR
jgi:antitoxin (DNA-binding transcriptional repressor) of toxin-antitoxin stability system